MKWPTTTRSCCQGSASCCLRARLPSPVRSASKPCRSTADRGRWSSNARRLPCGPRRAISSSPGMAGYWRRPSTRARRRCGRGHPGHAVAAYGGARLRKLAIQPLVHGDPAVLPAGFTDTRVVSVGRDGAALAFDLLPSDRYANPRISPDGRRLLVGDRWQRHRSARSGARHARPAHGGALNTIFSTWSADGSRVVFNRFNSPFWAAADGSGKAAPCPARPSTIFPRRLDPIRTPWSSSAFGPRRRGMSSDVDQRRLRTQATDRHACL